MDTAALLIIEVLNGIASLALACAGLAIIFGMMRVINFAHGEFMMLGAYTTVVCTKTLGINIWISMLIISPIIVGIIGIIVERTFIRFFYGRMIDTLIATWGLSLLLIGIVTAIFGNIIEGVSAPMGSFEVGVYNVSQYRMVLIGIVILLFIGVFMVLTRTKLGLIARGTMQNPAQASVLGISTQRVYMVTFAVGAGLTGLAGGLLAPISQVIPTAGAAYVAQTFITVITGGTGAVTGTLVASGVFGTVRQLLSYEFTPVLGGVGLLIVAVVMLRLCRKASPARSSGARCDGARRQPATLGGLGTILVLVVMVVLLFAGPQIFDLFTLFKVTLFVAMAILALSMGFIWGYGGILCFGQSAFYGLGAYTYAIAVGNIGESTGPFFLAIIVPAAFAALLGYFMFYGRLSDVYLAVVTLAVTLILYNFMRSTAGEEYAIGAQRLMGFNGISSIQPINWPGDGNAMLFPDEIFHLSMGCLILCYAGLKLLNRSHFGRVAVAIRENELRAELLGYDVRLHKLQTFTIGGGMAGLAGCLGVNFNSFVNPDVFALNFAAEIIMWTLIGGLGTLVGPMIGCIGLLMLKFEIGQQQITNTYLIFGGIIMVFVLAVPAGLLPTARQLADRFLPGLGSGGAEAQSRREAAQ